jgi:DNA-binding GntR family transcriptional regulator
MTTFQSIYKEIRERICLLQYPPGMALREGSLAEEFGVSRTPIRRVLHRLEFEGLITISHGSGAIVTTVDLKSLKEVYALRLKLVELIGELSPTRISTAQIEELEELREKCQEMRDEYDPVALARLYNRFHEVMLGVIGNRALRQFSDQLFHQTTRVWLQILPDLDWTTEVDKIVEEIGDVIVALRGDDMPRVAQIRREHMSMLLGRLNDYLSSAIVG